MINVQPYHDKLDKLQEWINLRIDSYTDTVLWLDFSSLPVTSPQQILRVFQEIGCVIMSSATVILEPKFITFNEYCDENRD